MTQQEMEIALLRQELELTKKLLEEKESRNKDLQKSLLLLENKIGENMSHATVTPKKRWWQIFK